MKKNQNLAPPQDVGTWIGANFYVSITLFFYRKNEGTKRSETIIQFKWGLVAQWLFKHQTVNLQSRVQIWPFTNLLEHVSSLLGNASRVGMGIAGWLLQRQKKGTKISKNIERKKIN